MSTAGNGRRRLLLICVGLAAAALALWGSSRLTWFSATVTTPTRGTVALAATGGDLVPALSGVALLALAAVAAAVAVSGVARRVLGVLLLAAAIGTGVAVVAEVAGPPSVEELVALLHVSLGSDPTATLPQAPVGVTLAPWLGVVGTVLLLAAGAALLAGERGLPRLGGRYAAPGARRPAADPDRAAWQELDAGRDPTVDDTDDTDGAGDATDGAARPDIRPGGESPTKRV